MPATKIVNETEVLRWFEEGRTYAWMSRQYLDKYHLEMGASAWANFRKRRGLDGRIVVDTQLIPWHVKPEHMADYYVRMLRAEARHRAGREVNEADAERLERFRARLLEDDLVVHYDPDLEEGFVLVPRRQGIDLDLIREPIQGDPGVRR